MGGWGPLVLPEPTARLGHNGPKIAFHSCFYFLIQRNTFKAKITYDVLIVHTQFFSLLETWILHDLFFMSCFAKLCKKWARGFCLQPLSLIFALRARNYTGELKACKVNLLPQLYLSPRMTGRKPYTASGVWCCGVLSNLGAEGMGKKKCQWGRSKIVVGFCFGFVVISHVVLVELLRPWESLPNAMI